MTFIQPKKESGFGQVYLLLLLVPLVFQVILLVVFYTKTVDLTQSISRMNADVQKIGTENAQMKDKVFALFNTDSLSRIAEERHLVQDKKPHYFTLGPQQWAFASQ